MPLQYNLDELNSRLQKALVGRGDIRQVEAEIRQYLRSAARRRYMENVRRLRLMLGDLLLADERHSEARRQFRMVLQSEPESVAAWIGLGDTSIMSGQRFRARATFETALAKATEQQDASGQLAALDGLAFLAADRKVLADVLDRMCSIITASPCEADMPLGVVESLIEEGQEADAVPLLRCYTNHLLAHGSVGGKLSNVLRYLAVVYQHMGLSDIEITDNLQNLCSKEIFK